VKMEERNLTLIQEKREIVFPNRNGRNQEGINQEKLRGGGGGYLGGADKFKGGNLYEKRGDLSGKKERPPV